MSRRRAGSSRPFSSAGFINSSNASDANMGGAGNDISSAQSSADSSDQSQMVVDKDNQMMND